MANKKMNILNNKTSKILIKVIPLLIITALLIQFTIVSASNNSSESIIPVNEALIINNKIEEINQIIEINKTLNINQKIDINKTKEEIDLINQTNELSPVNETNKTKRKLNVTVDIKDSKSNQLNVKINILNKEGELIKQLETGTFETSILSEENQIDAGIYDIEIIPGKHSIKKIKFNGVYLTQSIELGLDDVPEKNIIDKNFVKIYAIDPTNLNFTNATVTVTAKGNLLYKCKDWNFKEQRCYGDWELFKTGLAPGEEYTFTLTSIDPGFAESVTTCAAEDQATKGSFAGACDNPTGLNLELNDNTNLETHTFDKSNYGGVRIQSVNTSEVDCKSITSVYICYEWWYTGTRVPIDCDVSVDADGGSSYTAVTASCPSTTANPGVTCADITSLETWACANFFGATGTRAYAKSELTRTTSGPSAVQTATWDVLFFNITYSGQDVTPPTISLGNPLNNSWTNSTNTTFYFTPNDADSGLANCSLVINNVLNQTNRTSLAEGSQNSIWAIIGQGIYNWTVNCTDDATTPNTGASTSIKIINVDTTFPSINLTAPANNNVTIDDYIIFNFTATDNMATILNCSIYLNNTLNQTNASTKNGTATLFNISGMPDGYYSWNISCLDNATNVNWSPSRNFEINISPYIGSVADTPDPIKGGNSIAIEPSNVIDPNTDNLRYYCSENSAPTSSNTNCTQGNTVYTSPYSTMNCTFNTQVDTTTHTIYCRVYDGAFYSDTVSTTYTTDSTPPSLSSTVTIIPNVTTSSTAQTATLPATFYDRYNDGLMNITVTGESGMSCRYYTTDTAYDGATGTACVTNGINATCQPVVDTQGSDAHNFYISCADNLSNGQSTSQNIDIISLVTDWSSPTTTDNSNTNIQVPTYTVTITEADNVDGDPTSYYCIDTTGTCSPTNAIDNGGLVQFTTSNRGRNYLLYYSIDDAGNNQTAQNKTININQLVNFSYAADDAATIQGGKNITITTNSSDADSQTLKLYVCSSASVNSSGCIDGTYCSNTTGTDNLTCSFISETDDAAHIWYAYIYDSLNESSQNNYSGSYTTDSTAPTITINAPQSTTYPQSTITATITLSEAGSWAAYSLNGAANVSLTNTSPTIWTKQISGLSDGNYNLTFYVNDTVNNIANKTVNFTIDAAVLDTVAPVITAVFPTNGSTYTTNYIYLNITINENASWAAYSLDGAANVTMTNASPSDWYKNITSITDAVHQIKFYANDTSNNIGNSSTILFTKDSNPPKYLIYNNTPLTPDDTQNVTCYSHWNDTVGLSYAIIEENSTGSFVNHTLPLSGTDGWGNYTINAANLTPGAMQCRAYANDTLGNLNLTSAWAFTVSDITPPNMNISYTPVSEDDLDPDVLINISANVSDNVAVNTVILQYKNSTEISWNNYTMSKVSTTYYGNFTPTNPGNYTFRVWANDSSNNINTSSSITVEVKQDATWIVTPSAFNTVSALLNQNTTLGTILINVTGDYALGFDLSYTPATISLYYNDTEPFTLSSGASKNISITATAPSAESSTTIAVKIDSTNSSASPDFTYVNGTLVSYTDGPYLYVIITLPASGASITQGATINISAQVKNIGSQDATGAWLKWTLPSDWANSTGLNRSIGFLGVGQTATHSMTATLSSSAATGTATLSVNSGCNENKNSSASVSVTVNAAPGAAPIAPSAPSAGAGGGGGGGGAVIGPSLTKTISGKELLETEETLEIVRGSGNSFPIKITNIYEEATMYDISLAVEGYLSQYLEISPEIINKVYPGQSKEFTITITSPTYMEQDTRLLEFTITARLEGKSTITQSDNTTITILTKKDLVEKRFVTLLIHELSREEAALGLEQALNDINAMLEAKFPTTKMEKLLEEAKKALEERDYKKVKELTEEISLMRENAFEANKVINEVKEQIKISEERGINMDEAKKLLNLALAAFEREDFEVALQRAKDAQLTQVLLSKGKFNILWFLKTYWWAVLIAILVLSISGKIIQRRMVVVMIERRLEDLSKEESTINNLKIELQEKTFKGKKLSTTEYYKQMYNYEKRLSEIRQIRAKLRSKRARIIRISNEIEILNKENEETIEKIKELQNAYYNKKTINKKQYERRKEEYKLRRAEIEESIILLETKLAKKDRLTALKAQIPPKNENTGPKQEIKTKKEKTIKIDFGKPLSPIKSIKEKEVFKVKTPGKELEELGEVFTKEQLDNIKKRAEESSKKVPLFEVEDVLKELDEEILAKKAEESPKPIKPLLKEKDILTEEYEPIIKQPIEEKPAKLALTKEQIEEVEVRLEKVKEHKIPTVSELVKQTEERFKEPIKKPFEAKKEDIIKTLKGTFELKQPNKLKKTFPW